MLALAGIEPGVTSDGQTHIRLAHQLHLRIASDHICRVVSRTVVHDNEFRRQLGLVQNAFDGFPDIAVRYTTVLADRSAASRDARA